MQYSEKAVWKGKDCCMKMGDKTYGSHQLPVRGPAGLLVSAYIDEGFRSIITEGPL